jgi:hypothetical protein
MGAFPSRFLGVILIVFATFLAFDASAQAEVVLTSAGSATQLPRSAGPHRHRETQALQHQLRLRMQQVFVVTERNPLTGELVGTPRRFTSRLAATEYRESLRAGAWIVWRYVGVNEPLRSVRFLNRFEAEQFIRTGGPSRRGLLGKLLLTNETRILPARVSLETEIVR